MRRDLIRLNLRLFVHFHNTTYTELEVRNRRYQQKIRVLCQRKWLFGGPCGEVPSCTNAGVWTVYHITIVAAAVQINWKCDNDGNRFKSSEI
jgi:hypothetical protein